MSYLDIHTQLSQLVILGMSFQKVFYKIIYKKLQLFLDSSQELDLYDLSSIRKLNNDNITKTLAANTTELYVSQWKKFSNKELELEALSLLEKRIPKAVIDQYIVGKKVLDFGCGSGRYSLALKAVGAKSVTALDYDIKFQRQQNIYVKKKV